MHDTTVTGDTIKIVLLAGIRVPVHLPNWVRVLLCPYRALVDGSFVFVAHIEDAYCAVVEPHGEQCG